MLGRLIRGCFRMFIKIFGNNYQRAEAFDRGYKEEINRRIDHYFALVDLEIKRPGNAGIIKNHLRFLAAMRPSISEEIEEKFLEECSNVIKQVATIEAFVCVSDKKSKWLKDESSRIVILFCKDLARLASTTPLWMLKPSLMKLKREIKKP